MMAQAAAQGIITTAAGNGTRTGSIDGEGGDPTDDIGDGSLATSPSLRLPVAVTFDPDGNLLISAHNRIRRVDFDTGIITTVAGSGQGFGGDGDPATSARLNFPVSLAIDQQDNLFIGEFSNQRVRKIDAASRVITTVAGNGVCCFSGDGGPATSAAIGIASGVAVDGNGNLYISSESNHRVRRVDALSGTINTIAGNGTRTGSIDGEGNDPVDDLGDGSVATNATLAVPRGLAVSPDRGLFIADAFNDRVRFVQSPFDSIEALVLRVMELNLSEGISNSLDSKLDAALQALDDLNENNDTAAIQSLSAFVSYVNAQSGKNIPASEAATA